MFRTNRPTESVATLDTLIGGVAKQFVERLYGPDGPAWGTHFRDLEELTYQIGQAVGRQMLDRALQQQAATAVPARDERCPSCQRPGTAAEPEPRIVTTRAGDAEWSEPARHCPRCRRAFFPAVETIGDRPQFGLAGRVGTGDLCRDAPPVVRASQPSAATVGRPDGLDQTGGAVDPTDRR